MPTTKDGVEDTARLLNPEVETCIIEWMEDADLEALVGSDAGRG